MTPPPTPGSDAAPEPAGAPRIVTAVTGDDSGMSALRWVLTWLDPVPGALRLLVVENSDVRRSQVQDAVGAAVEQLGEHAAARASPAVWWTAAAPARAHAIGRAIVERLGPADLLVLGSDRSTRMEGLTDSSLPLYVVAIASSPVVVVPRTWDPATRIVLLVGDNDDADADDLPLRFAAAHAHRLGSPLELA